MRGSAVCAVRSATRRLGESKSKRTGNWRVRTGVYGCQQYSKQCQVLFTSSLVLITSGGGILFPSNKLASKNA